MGKLDWFQRHGYSVPAAYLSDRNCCCEHIVKASLRRWMQFCLPTECEVGLIGAKWQEPARLCLRFNDVNLPRRGSGITWRLLRWPI